MAREAVKADVGQVAWLYGAWSCEVWDGTWNEHWSKPSGGTMQGHGKHIKDGTTPFMEYMSIEATADGGLNLWKLLGSPSRGRKMGVPFRLNLVSDSECVWSNPANDFPSTIAYRRTEDGIECRLSGKQGGKDSETVFDFKPLKS